MAVKDLDLNIDIELMKLGEQEEFELLSGCSLFQLSEKGLTGRRLAALIYIFAKRQDASVTFDECLNLDMNDASSMLADDVDPKEVTA